MNLKSLLPFHRSNGITQIGIEGDPFSALRHEMDRVFDDFTHGRNMVPALRGGNFLHPAVDVAETDKGVEIKAELPGLTHDDIDIELSENMLTLKAERNREHEEMDDKRKYHVSERTHGTYMRRFRLPFAVDPKKVTADFDNGVLKIFLPKPPGTEITAHKINIKAQ